VRLLNRTTRSVTPTEAGEKLLARLTPALADVALALDEVNAFRDSPTGTLKPERARRGGADRLSRPDPALPGRPSRRPVEITAEDAFVDVLAAGFDAGVRYDERLEKDMIAVPWPGRSGSWWSARPAYFAAHGRPAHPRDVLDHACIRHRFPSGTSYAWEFEKDGEVIRISPTGPLITTSGELELEACRGGRGPAGHLRGLRRRPTSRPAGWRRVLDDWLPPFSGPLSLLSQPPPHARAAAGVRGFRQGREIATHRQFDFWVGTLKNQIVARSLIALRRLRHSREMPLKGAAGSRRAGLVKNCRTG
jgi:DNA-binding transcriptional LysR family regulator